MKRMMGFLALAGLVVCCGGWFGKSVPKYVFLFIGDGMSTPQRMIANEYALKTGHGPLAMNTLPNHATTRTCSASSLVTDSAAAATAIACGEKTYNGAIGVNAEKKRLRSVAEAAKAAGRKVGIITTVTLNHATPAGFYGHRENRGMGYELGLDLITSGFDFFAGGGLSKHSDTNSPLWQGDIYDLAASAGYKIVRDRAAFGALRPSDGKVLTYMDENAFPFSIDRTDDDAQHPQIWEMVEKGIEMLEGDKGFFMMCEGGRIDWAGHSNDPAPNLEDVLALDRAVKVALDFAEKHPDETLVVVTGDHETGGMTMGFAGTGYNLFMERLAMQKCSTEAFGKKLKAACAGKKDVTFSQAKPLLEKNYGFIFGAGEPDAKNPMRISKKEQDELEKAFAKDAKSGFKKNTLGAAAKLVLSHKAGIGWTSGSHTALPVLTTAKGTCADMFMGFIDNTDISKKLKTFYE